MSGMIALVALVGCDVEGVLGFDFPRACDESKVDGDCIDFVGEVWTEEEIQQECTDGLLLDSCPEGEVGQCVIGAGTFDATTSYFYLPFWPGSQAAQRCASIGGTWIEA